jgi:peptide/nickel transport system substrate-binding protein
MKLNRQAFAAGLLMASAAVPAGLALAAERPKDTLVIVSEMGPNGLDTMVPTANDHSRMVNWQAYDRLLSHGEKKLADGTVSYDATVTTPELAESWDVTDDGKTYVFHLRKDATFHDGTPVTAKDVKWSFDRAIAAGGFAAVQMGAGSMVKPEQFSVIDDHTFKATFEAGPGCPHSHDRQLGACEEARHRQRPMGFGMGLTQ